MKCLLIFSESLNSKNNFFDEYEDIIFMKEDISSKLKDINELDVFLDFENLNLNKENTSKYIKFMKKIEKKIHKNKIKLEILNKFDIKNTKSEFEIFLMISAYSMKISDKKEKLIFLYDKICDFLDYQFVSKNLCDFKDNVCFAKRNANVQMGCCHHYKNTFCGILYEKNLNLCEYQIDKSCKAQCISCKMFVCDELIKKGVKFTNNNVLIIKYYFNFIQKIIIRVNFFKKREYILKKLLVFNY